MEWLCFYSGRISCIMGKLLPLLILIQCIQCYTEFTKEQLKSIMHEYMLVCGPRYVCDPERFDPVLVSKLGSMQYKSKCPDCKCDDECMSRGDCCPDVVLSLPPLKCNSVSMVNTMLRGRGPSRTKEEKKRKPLFYFLVDSCPTYNTNETLNSLCKKKYSVKERLLDPVVSSREFPASFRNKFCAMCNGFVNLTDWLLDFDCMHFSDLNFLSTYDSIIDQARKSRCTVKFSPEKNNVKSCKQQHQAVKVGHCNATGRLIQYNKDIQKACESSLLIQSYRIYKNVFCYMCNPSYSFDSVVNTCNNTGEWRPHHTGLEVSCTEYGASETTKPFKNIFCYLCNRDNTDSDSIVLDASASMKVSYSRRGSSIIATSLKIKVQKLNIKYYAKNILRPSTSIKTYGSISTYIKDVNPFDADGLFYPTYQTKKSGPIFTRTGVNMTQLLIHLMAIQPENQICRKDLIQPEFLVYQNYLSPCQCDPSCFFGLKSFYSKCCVDTVLTISKTCIDDAELFHFINAKPATFYGRINTPTVLPPMTPDSPVFSHHINSTIMLNRRTRSIKQFNSRLHRKRKRNKGKRKRTSPGQRGNVKRKKKLKYFVTNGCWGNKGHSYPRDRCNSHVGTDIYSILHLTDTVTKVQYFSYDCFLCNLRRWGIQDMATLSDSLLNDDYYKVWDISISCQGLLNFDHYVLLYDILKFAKQSKCTVRTFPSRKDIFINTNGYNETTRLERTYCTNDQRQQIGQKCNETGKWVERDPNIVWACENTNKHALQRYGGFKNVFCFLCNPTKLINSYTETIVECNTTGLWITYDPNIDRACQLFPLVTTHYPYKNWFCQACNENFFHTETERMRFAPKGGHHSSKSNIPRPISKATFRSIFSLEIYNEDEQNSQYCDNGTFVGTEQKPCRPVLCFPGRILKNGKCMPLLTFTNNLRYSMAFKLTIKEKSLHVQHNVSQLMKQLETALRRFFENLFNVKPIYVEQLHILANSPCQVNIRDDLEFLVHITIFVQGYTYRESSENMLSGIQSNSLTIKNNASFVTFNVVKSLEAMHVLTILQNVDYLSSCSIQINQNKAFIPSLEYRSVFVTPVLSCRQVELENAEFYVDWTDMSATIRHLNRTLTFTEFHLSDGGKMRVCIKDITKALSSYSEDSTIEDNYFENVLGQVTFICTVISLCCLFVTFITYCLFSKLRSIPGINNMNLIFALFCAQLCLQLGVQVPNESVYCIVTGIIIHIFWLAVFSCMTMCSFHMYYVFAGSGSVSATRLKVSIKSKRLWKYSSFSFVVPVIIVSTNLLITFLIDGRTPAYGDKLCFISNRISYVVAFLLPIVAACFSNIYFFITTVSRMKNNSKNLGLNQERKYQFTIYIKLFMITGISWLLVIIDSFFDLSTLSFIAAFVNGLQGLFIFVSYICNKRILNMYRAQFCRTRNRKSPKDSNTKTVSTDAVCHTIAESCSKDSDETVNHDSTGKYDCDAVPEIKSDSVDSPTKVNATININASQTFGAINNAHTQYANAGNDGDNDANTECTLAETRCGNEKDICNVNAIMYNKIDQADSTRNTQNVVIENR